MAALESNDSVVPEEPPFWLSAAKWCGGCVAFFAIVEGMTYVVQKKAAEGDVLFPPTFALKVTLTGMGLGLLWILLKRVWPLVPRTAWLRSVRRMVIRFGRFTLIFLAAIVLMDQINEISVLHGTSSRGVFGYLVLDPQAPLFTLVILMNSFICLFLPIMILEIIVPIIAKRRRQKSQS